MWNRERKDAVWEVVSEYGRPVQSFDECFHTKRRVSAATSLTGYELCEHRRRHVANFAART